MEAADETSSLTIKAQARCSTTALTALVLIVVFVPCAVAAAAQSLSDVAVFSGTRISAGDPQIVFLSQANDTDKDLQQPESQDSTGDEDIEEDCS